jgi:hypothetical protein
VAVKQIIISKTKGEWAYIQEKLLELGSKTTLASYITCESKKLHEKFKECPDCISPASGERIENRPYIPITTYQKLEPIALKMGIPVSAVIDRLIISPILLPH